MKKGKIDKKGMGFQNKQTYPVLSCYILKSIEVDMCCVEREGKMRLEEMRSVTRKTEQRRKHISLGHLLESEL